MKKLNVQHAEHQLFLTSPKLSLLKLANRDVLREFATDLIKFLMNKTVRLAMQHLLQPILKLLVTIKLRTNNKSNLKLT